MGDATKKRERGTAKGLFTKSHKTVKNALDINDDIDIVNSRFGNFKNRWCKLQEAHEQYLQTVNDDTLIETEDTWIDACETDYDSIERLYFLYLKQEKEKEQEESKVMVNQAASDSNIKVEKLKCVRKLEEVTFNGLLTSFNDFVSASDCDLFETMKCLFQDIKEQFEKCKVANTNYIESLETSDIDGEIKWFSAVQQRYIAAVKKYGIFADEKVRLKESSRGPQYRLKLEPMRLPKFDGNIRDYPTFKHDFQTYVLPQLGLSDSAPYILKSCLTGEPYDLLKNVDDQYDEMWHRLNDRYGKPSKLVEIVMKDIKAMRLIPENNDSKLIDLVNIMERGYRDLKRIGFEKEMSNSTTVSMVEAILPKSVKREWSREVNRKDSKVDDKNKFHHLLEFLLEQKRILEYEAADLRKAPSIEGSRSGDAVNFKGYCWLHKSSSHSIDDCLSYNKKTHEEKASCVKEFAACYNCLETGHRLSDCPNKRKCGVDKCERFHHKSLHESHAAGLIFHSLVESDTDTCLLQIMEVRTPTRGTSVNVLWDGGATSSLITFKKALDLKLKGRKISLSIVKVGGEIQHIDSTLYQLPLKDNSGSTIHFEVYGIETISSPCQKLDLSGIDALFPKINEIELHRPEGEIDVLIGLNYASHHPQIEESVEQLVLVSNRFGRCLAGKHPDVKETTKKVLSYAKINFMQVMPPSISEFFSCESLGIRCESPRCGACKCGKCPLGGKDYNLKEERELMLIEKGLKHENGIWTATYPWKRDPYDLPDNRSVAFATLRSTEKRLLKDPTTAEQYKKQMEEMLENSVARKLNPEELRSYNGPTHYISHHEVRKESSSTPCRIVFNASANYQGHILNEYWAKGPDFINNLLGVLLRFREDYCAIVGDIRRMYHTIKLSPIDQQTHRFLWRDLDIVKSPDTYAMTSVCFGDKPASAISSLALRKTAEMQRDEYPEAVATIIDNTYVDDIIDCVPSRANGQQLTNDIETVLSKGGFKIKLWTYSGDESAEKCFSDGNGTENPVVEKHPTQKVLGVCWDPAKDCFKFRVKLNFHVKKRKVRIGANVRKEEVSAIPSERFTKREILSQINGLYDPIGLLTPFTVRAKILMRSLWSCNDGRLGWDDPIPVDEREKWMEFFTEMFDLEEINFKRCMKPDAVVEDPTLVLFSDGSERAYGSCAYIRWGLADGTFVSRLLCSKSRVAPLKVVSIVRLELNGALLSARLKVFIEKVMSIRFSQVYFLIDSEVVLAMLQKQSYGFQSYAAVRIGEIQQSTQLENWYWIESNLNIADCLTKGVSPADLGETSKWQLGPLFLQQKVEEWPIRQDCNVLQIPEQIREILHNVTKVVDKLSLRINIKKFSSYIMLLFTTARVLSFYRKIPTPSLKNALLTPTRDDLNNAEMFWILDAQSEFTDKVIREKFLRLSPRVREDGVIVVGSRMERWLEECYSSNGIILLPNNHSLSKLYACFVHNLSHLGIATTVSKIRRKFWIPNLTKTAKSIINKCIPCKIKRKNNASQLMSSLPIERLKPAPAWHSVALDYFGPIEIKGEVNKRSRGKCYGVLFNSLEMRAVHIDVAGDCSTDAFLMVLRRFGCMRGWPSSMLSDNASQFQKASKRMKDILKGMDWEKIKKFGAQNGIEWKFAPADSPWHNGCSESLVKSAKLAIKVAIKDQVMSFPELQTVVFEAANMLNERPIGRHPTNPDEGAYLCPNDLLLGRATSRIPGGPFDESTALKRRHEFVQNIANSFWRKMTRDYFPSLIVRGKWHVQKRNMSVGDVVIMQDSNTLRGEWKLGIVSKVMPSLDGLVRKCQVKYKNVHQNGNISTQYTYVTRAVQRLIVLVPVEDR